MGGCWGERGWGGWKEGGSPETKGREDGRTDGVGGVRVGRVAENRAVEVGGRERGGV